MAINTIEFSWTAQARFNKEDGCSIKRYSKSVEEDRGREGLRDNQENHSDTKKSDTGTMCRY